MLAYQGGKRVSPTVGDLSAATATRVINATGLAVTPGFIDVHSHADAALLRDGQHACGIRQGVTTEIIAPDGLNSGSALARQLSDVHALLERHLGLRAGRVGHVDVCHGDVELPQQDFVQRCSCSSVTARFDWRPSERHEGRAAGGGRMGNAPNGSFARVLSREPAAFRDRAFVLPELLLRHRRTRQHHERSQRVRSSSFDPP